MVCFVIFFLFVSFCARRWRVVEVWMESARAKNYSLRFVRHISFLIIIIIIINEDML